MLNETVEDLLATVRSRYGRAVSYRGLMTLVLRRQAVRGGTEQHRGSAPLDFRVPQLNTISRQLRGEMERLLESREKLALQTLGRDMRKLVERQTGVWRADIAGAERVRKNTLRRAEKRVELLAADTALQLRTVSRDVERLKTQELARRREVPDHPDDRPLSHRAARRLTQESVRRESERTHREIADAARRAERRVLQRMRDEAAYERSRTGIGR